MSPTVLRTSGYQAPEIELAYNYNLKRKQLRDIENIIEEHEQEIIDAWNDHFGG